MLRGGLITSLTELGVKGRSVAVWGTLLLLSVVTSSAFAAPSEGAPRRPAEAVGPALSSQAALPPEASVEMSSVVDGKVLRYHAAAGAIPVFDDQGKRIADVGYVSFVLDGQTAGSRPVTFAFGGGPGASSGSLVFALGPKRVSAGVQGDTPSTSIEMTDNPTTWLEFTDLVFLDPVGTGFSRAYVPAEAVSREFFGVEQDVKYLSGVIYDWLKLKERMSSPKYVVGESYGGFRAPRIVEELDYWRGVGVSGLVLISPILDFNVKTATGASPETLSPMSWAVDLPSMVAAKYESEGRTLTPQLMHDVEEYARGDYVAALLKGTSDPTSFEHMVKRVADLTGIDEARVRQLGGRLEQSVFLREAKRSSGLIGSRYDIDWVAPDPFPWSNASKGQDMVVSTFTMEAGATTDLVTRIIGWKVDGRYWPYNPTLPRWTGFDRNTESLTAIRHLLALDSKFKLLIAHGYTDLSCSYLMSRLAVDQVPKALVGNRLELKIYPGGHMFYDRPGSASGFKADARHLYP